jgi:hypothetical protein
VAKALKLKKELRENNIQFISFNKKSKDLYFRDNRGLETKHLYFNNYREVEEWWKFQKHMST